MSLFLKDKKVDLSGKVAIVTGSGRGIGQTIALRLSEAGATIVINDINETLANQTVEQIKASGRPGMVALADVSSAVDVNRMATAVKEAYGKIDIG